MTVTPRLSNGHLNCSLVGTLAGFLWLVAIAAGRADQPFPAEFVEFTPHPQNPLFAGSGTDTWDHKIRERGWILREGQRWHLWYTGYRDQRAAIRQLGYATSNDGIRWTRHPDNPIFDDAWVEDMQVVKHQGTYYMVAEGRNDIAHMLTSPNGIDWTPLGPLDVRSTDGRPLAAGPYGTPTLWIEGEIWYLFYERRDRGIWLAKSSDRKVWTNVQDAPVIPRGPQDYDRAAVALNQVFQHHDRYYAVYHANADPQWQGPWTTCLAVSDDLFHWTKYAGNPIIRGDHSSGQFVHDGTTWRLYTMHPDVRLFLPRRASRAGTGHGLLRVKLPVTPASARSLRR